MSSFDCDLFIQTILPKLYGYNLDNSPDCCDGQSIICDTPGEVTSSSRIIKLIYGNYSLGGYLPDQIGSLTALQGLYLNDNQLHGPIPSSVNNLLNLQWLHLENNQFSGQIPDISNDKELLDVFLQNNQLTGTVPASIGTLPKLTQLNLSNNMLSGDLPFTSSVPNSRYEFGAQRPPPSSPLGPASLNPITLPALLSFLGFLLVIIALVWTFRRNKNQSKKQPVETEIQMDYAVNRVGSDRTETSLDSNSSYNYFQTSHDSDLEIAAFSHEPKSKPLFDDEIADQKSILPGVSQIAVISHEPGENIS